MDRKKTMLAQTDFPHQARDNWRTHIADLLSRTIAHIRENRRRAAWRRELLALDDRQLRDAGINIEHVGGSRNAARAAVRTANLSALR